MERMRLLVIATAIILAFNVTTAKAALIKVSYEEIQTQADIILLGRVTGSTSKQGSGEILPYQQKHVSVQHYYKGSGSQSLDVKVLGGDSMWVEDQPELSIGTTYVLFLWADGHGNYIVYGGPQGALVVSGGVATNFSYKLRVTDSELIPVPASGVSVSSAQNATYPMVHEPADFILYVGDVYEPGYWNFHVVFRGVSGLAMGLVSEQEVSDFVYSGSYNHVPFSHNFTASGTYQVEVDGKVLGEVEVRPPNPQVTLSWAEFSDTPLHVYEPFTMRVGSIPNIAGEYRAFAVITPRKSGIEPFDWSYASYRSDSNWFTFHFDVREPGNYTVTIWQGGVMQLTKTMEVLPALEVIAAEPAITGVPAERTYLLPEYSWLLPLLLAAIVLVTIIGVLLRRRESNRE
jgi:hypothetical protein